MENFESRVTFPGGKCLKQPTQPLNSPAADCHRLSSKSEIGTCHLSVLVGHAVRKEELRQVMLLRESGCSLTKVKPTPYNSR